MASEQAWGGTFRIGLSHAARSHRRSQQANKKADSSPGTAARASRENRCVQRQRSPCHGTTTAELQQVAPGLIVHGGGAFEATLPQEHAVTRVDAPQARPEPPYHEGPTVLHGNAVALRIDHTIEHVLDWHRHDPFVPGRTSRDFVSSWHTSWSARTCAAEPHARMQTLPQDVSVGFRGREPEMNFSRKHDARVGPS